MASPNKDLISTIKRKINDDGYVGLLQSAPGYARYRIASKIWRYKLRLGYASVGSTRIKTGFSIPGEMIDCVSPGLELGERKLAKELPEDFPVIELGAGIGLVTAEVNSSLTQGTEHIAVEVDPKLISVLENTRDLNGMSVQILNAGYHPVQESVSFRRSGGYINTETVEKDNKSQVDAVNLKQLYEMVNSEYITLVADIEGAEEGFLKEWSVIKNNCAAAMIEFHKEESLVKENFESSDVFEQTGREGGVVRYKRQCI